MQTHLALDGGAHDDVAEDDAGGQTAVGLAQHHAAQLLHVGAVDAALVDGGDLDGIANADVGRPNVWVGVLGLGDDLVVQVGEELGGALPRGFELGLGLFVAVEVKVVHFVRVAGGGLIAIGGVGDGGEGRPGGT